MSRKSISTDKAPAAIGPYSQAVTFANALFTSGALPIDPATGTMVEGTIEDRAHMVFKNLAAVAEAAGTSLGNTVKTTVFLSDIADFQAVNSVYTQYFSEPFPARSAIQVAALPLGSNIEVEAIIAL
jgi:2-iminobutanoate/2-iminopropanoate deaminase